MRKKSRKIVLQRETVMMLDAKDLREAAGQACPSLPCTNHICTTKAANNCTDICSAVCSSL